MAKQHVVKVDGVHSLNQALVVYCNHTRFKTYMVWRCIKKKKHKVPIFIEFYRDTRYTILMWKVCNDSCECTVLQTTTISHESLQTITKLLLHCYYIIQFASNYSTSEYLWFKYFHKHNDQWGFLCLIGHLQKCPFTKYNLPTSNYNCVKANTSHE